jgi:hypothetical protein
LFRFDFGRNDRLDRFFYGDRLWFRFGFYDSRFRLRRRFNYGGFRFGFYCNRFRFFNYRRRFRFGRFIAIPGFWYREITIVVTVERYPRYVGRRGFRNHLLGWWRGRFGHDRFGFCRLCFGYGRFRFYSRLLHRRRNLDFQVAIRFGGGFGHRRSIIRRWRKLYL